MPNHASMPYRSLGLCGMKVSAFGLGGWTTFGGSVNDESIVQSIITRAFDLGVNFFDIADVYSKGKSEIEMGKVLKTLPRNELVISSKLYFPISDDVNDRGLSRKHIFESVHKSLKNIGTDYLDIYFCHRFDSETPLLETIRAMNDLITQGKTHYWGTSGWQVEQLEECHKICKAQNFYAPQVEQPEFNLINRKYFEKSLAPFTAKTGMGTVTWSPLASGLLSGKYSQNAIPNGSRLSNIEWLKDRLLTPENLSRADQLAVLAKTLDMKPSQLALAWTVAQPGVSSVILGVSKVEQLEENLKSLSYQVSATVFEKLNKIFS